MRLSRHSRNNMRLYGISGDDILKAIKSPDSTGKEGTKTVAIKKLGKRFSGYPLKIVYEVIEGDECIITAYPLKRKMWR